MALARQGNKKQTICLCMIVKNESHVIERSLRSVKGIVDYVVICDTGSTDGTQEVIRSFLDSNKMKGVVYDKEWVNFSHNRTECFSLAPKKYDYLMTLDADEVLSKYKDGEVIEFPMVARLPKFTKDMVFLLTSYGDSRYQRVGFFNNKIPWEWKQPLHEYPHSDKCKGSEYLEGLCTYSRIEGARSKDPQKYMKDALVFEHWLLDNPEDGRAWFYLTQSYGDAGMYERALKSSETALKLATWNEEKYMLHLRVGYFKRSLGKSFYDVLPDYLLAVNESPGRIEALTEIVKGCIDEGSYNTAILFGKEAVKKSEPGKYDLFANKAIYDWILKDHMSLAYYYSGQKEKGKELLEILLAEKKAPEECMKRFESNYEFYR